MAAGFTQEGFKEIRKYIQELIKYVNIKDEQGNILFTLDINDSRITGLLPDAYEVNPIVINVFLIGTDAEIDMGTKIGGAGLVKEIGGIEFISIDYKNPFEFEHPEDQLDVRINVKIPDIGIPSTPIP